MAGSGRWKPLTLGGPARWPQILETKTTTSFDKGPFAVDVLTAPESNPWLAQMRFSGLDFYADGSMAICTWDGDVWHVRMDGNERILKWQRIASGLYQPLGLKVIRDRIYLTCRDQLAVLHDLNGDGEIDFYQCLNNDHQVTEHFHEAGRLSIGKIVGPFAPRRTVHALSYLRIAAYSRFVASLPKGRIRSVKLGQVVDVKE